MCYSEKKHSQFHEIVSLQRGKRKKKKKPPILDEAPKAPTVVLGSSNTIFTLILTGTMRSAYDYFHGTD